MTYDVVIRNGHVVDGSGVDAVRTDVGVVDGRIAAVGEVDERGAEEIDADGHVVTPGFIDGHTHLDAQVFWDHAGSSSCWHGVTTAVMGHCGFTLAPARSEARHLVVRNLERAEDMSPAALAEGITWSWESFAGYLDAVDRLPKGINYVTHVGHSALRTWAMGERAFEGPANDDDLAHMERELHSALDAGAFGFSTSRGDQHETSDGRPVASRIAEWSEITRLVHAVADHPGGLFQLAPEPAWYSLDDEERHRSWAALFDLAVESRVPMMFGLPATGPTWPERLDYLDRAAAAGGRMVGVSRSRVLTNILSFRTRMPYDALEEWRPVRALPHDEQLAALRDPEVRARLVHAARHGEYPRALGGEPKKPDYELMSVFERAVGHNPTLAELAAATGRDPAEIVIDRAVESDLSQLFLQVHTRPDLTAQAEVMRHPSTVMSFSDAGAHISQISDWSLQTFLLAFWVRERQMFTLEEAIHWMTGAPAEAWGLHDRGVVRVGAVADLNVLDPEHVAPELPVVVNDLPGGGPRLLQRARGFLATVVGGQVTMRDGTWTGATPGVLVRRQGKQSDRR